MYAHSKPESIFDTLITTTTDSIYDSTIKLYVTSILEISPWKVVNYFELYYFLLYISTKVPHRLHYQGEEDFISGV